jgi:hypothetical protein
MIGTIMTAVALLGIMAYMIIDTKIEDRKRKREEEKRRK